MSVDSIPRRRGKKLVARRRGGQKTQAGEFEKIAAAQRSRRVEPFEGITPHAPPLLPPPQNLAVSPANRYLPSTSYTPAAMLPFTSSGLFTKPMTGGLLSVRLL